MVNSQTFRAENPGDALTPSLIQDVQCNIAGAGGAGSWQVLLLAKSGFSNIHVFDAKSVSENNVRNQAYGTDDVGAPKIEALRRAVIRHTIVPTSLHTHKKPVDRAVALRGVVFISADYYKNRMSILEGILSQRDNIDQVIDTRFGQTEYRVYHFDPKSEAEVSRYMDTLGREPTPRVFREFSGPVDVVVAAVAKSISVLRNWLLSRAGLYAESVPWEIAEDTQPRMLINREATEAAKKLSRGYQFTVQFGGHGAPKYPLEVSAGQRVLELLQNSGFKENPEDYDLRVNRQIASWDDQIEPGAKVIVLRKISGA